MGAMRPTDAYEGLVAETTSVRSASDDYVHAYLARPLGPGPFPAVVLFHHRPGWDEWYRQVTRRFAHHGYLAICPDLFCRFGHGQPDDVAARAIAKGDVHDEQVVADGRGCVDFLRALSSSNGKVGLVRDVLGRAPRLPGRVQARARRRRGDRLLGRAGRDGAGGPQRGLPVAPIDLTPDLTAPLLGLFGLEDRSPSPEQVDQHEAELRRLGKTYEFHRYEGAGHGFMYEHRPPAYRAEAAIDGWAKVWDFLARELG